MLRISLLLAFFGLLSMQPLAAATDEPIGRVVASEGSVKALGAASRVLSKGSEIFRQETVDVSSDGKVEIRFTDGGTVNLIASTQFSVDAYQIKTAEAKEQFTGNLLRGGLRFLSGSIAKENPEQAEIKTPTATIGLRGTVVEAAIIQSNLYVAVTEGRALVANSAGSLLIGVGEKSQFTYVAGSQISPELILQRPRELDPKLFLPPKAAPPNAPGSAIQSGSPPQEKTSPASTPRAGATIRSSPC